MTTYPIVKIAEIKVRLLEPLKKPKDGDFIGTKDGECLQMAKIEEDSLLGILCLTRFVDNDGNTHSVAQSIKHNKIYRLEQPND